MLGPCRSRRKGVAGEGQQKRQIASRQQEKRGDEIFIYDEAKRRRKEEITTDVIKKKEARRLASEANAACCVTRMRRKSWACAGWVKLAGVLFPGVCSSFCSSGVLLGRGGLGRALQVNG